MSDESNAHTMQCLEVWGGNTSATNAVGMAGLDAWVYARPFEGGSGGDLYYVSSCATGRIVRVLVADVSGHGAAVSDTAVRLRGLMRKYVNYFDQRKFVSELNRSFVTSETTGRFATAVVASVWTPTNELVLSRAGHPRPFIRRAGSGGWEVVPDGEDARRASAKTANARGSLDAASQGAGAGDERPADLPLGVMEPVRYNEQRLKMGPDDVALLYTDALVEIKDANGRIIGEQGLLGLLDAIDPQPHETLLDRFAASLSERFGAIDDDLTMLLLRPNERKPRMTPLSGVAAGARIARETLRSLRRPGEVPVPEVNARNIGGAFIDGMNRDAKPRE
ncbi:MAG: PP2C family protein-serine/threonine phosphatase [Phycisphaerales bacterium]|jgi:hypothetical protein|nr:PP2C family protein-serine/threonine phosphatase [Phycisphaerales bacterium]